MTVQHPWQCHCLPCRKTRQTLNKVFISVLVLVVGNSLQHGQKFVQTQFSWHHSWKKLQFGELSAIINVTTKLQIAWNVHSESSERSSYSLNFSWQMAADRKFVTENSMTSGVLVLELLSLIHHLQHVSWASFLTSFVPQLFNLSKEILCSAMWTLNEVIMHSLL